jgi:hypothetical protein
LPATGRLAAATSTPAAKGSTPKTLAGPLFRVADRRAQIAALIHSAGPGHLGPDHFGRAVTNLHRLDTAPALTQPRAGG